MEMRATVLDPLRWIVKFKPLLKTSAPNGKVAPKEARSSNRPVTHHPCDNVICQFTEAQYLRSKLIRSVEVGGKEAIHPLAVHGW